MTLSSNSFIMSDSHITVCFSDGFQHTTYSSDPSFFAMRSAVRDGDWDRARSLATPAEAIQAALAGTESGAVRIEDGVVYFDDVEIHNTLTDRMLEMLADGFDVMPMMLFLENLMANPSYRAVNELYDFLEASQLPITEDGHFLAYKRIKGDYTDIYSGTMDNSIGAIVEMPRNGVDEDKNRTCSAGLHFCARSYLSSYGTSSGNRTVVVKINPADVVAIPSDYNNAKGRACRYEIIQELEHLQELEIEGAYSDNDDVAEVLKMDDDGNIIDRYENVEEASADTGIPKSYIARVLRGDRPRTGGFRWAHALREEADYIDDLTDEFEDDDGVFDEEDSDLDFRF